MKKIFPLSIFLLIVINAFNQNYWTKTTAASLENKQKVNRSSFPKEANYYQLDIAAFSAYLLNAPERFQANAVGLIVSFPTANGSFENFRVFHSPIMHPELAAKYPIIKTYAAQGVEDPTAFMRFSITQFGVHTMCLSATKSTTYIDPFTTDRLSYIVYNKATLGADPQGFECLVDEAVHLPSLENDGVAPTAAKAVNDSKFRIFRLAQSCTAEYGNIFANTGTELADIQAQMAISINRVNTVYEIDLGIQLQFIANNDLLIYFGNVNADPWNGEWNTTTAQTIDAAVGVSNYDIGHNFNTEGGGNAGCIGCVCLSQSQSGTHKGRGYTGRANPTGDPFDIDYVAHEMGHQLGGYHTQSNQSCRSGSGLTEVEPGSASTVMGYAGICAANVQSNSDAHFNYVNIRDISANVKPGGNSTCANEITTTNLPPTANAGLDYVIPKSTAFILEGTASDPNGSATLSYEWSQNDPENPNSDNAPTATRTQGPMYRSIYPTTSPNRYMPNIASVLAGNLTPTWEVTPSVARTMEFAFVVRDNDVQGGQTADDLMTVTVSGTAGPFQVTSHNTPQNWIAGQTKTIMWNVAGTNSGTVNTPNVNILLSLDGGYTYPIVLASNVPNDGSENVSIPGNAISSTCRIMVRGAGNIFYALNGANINIEPGDFIMDFTETNKTSCAGENVSYTFTYTPLAGFTENTVFSITNLPAGANAVFTPANASATTNVNLTISNLSVVNTGIYNLVLQAAATSSSQTTNLSLEVATIPNAPSLVSPVNLATNVANSTTLNWTAITGNNVTYTLQIATDINFTTLVENVANLTANSYSSTLLNNGTNYFWRVKATNLCGSSPFSTTNVFTTSTCFTAVSANVPIVISNQGTPTITSTLTIATPGIIDDLDVIDIIGNHTRVGNLTVSLTSPAGTTVVLWANVCGTQNDFVINFDDEATSGTILCPPTGNFFYIPIDPLSSFDGENVQGTWTLTVSDNANQGGGDLEAWSLAVCLSSAPCNKPDVPTIIADDNAICSGTSTAISVVSGNLNDAAYWQWYAGTCGGTQVGTGTTLSVAPGSTETYFVRGEGACIFIPEACASQLITVNPVIIINETINAIDSAMVNGTWYFASENIQNVYVSAEGCDSVVRTNLIITYSNPNAIISLENENAIQIFPNPNQGEFKVLLNEGLGFNEQNTFYITNMLGQKVFEIQNVQTEQLNIHIENIAKGVYQLHFENKNIRMKKEMLVF